ncbi:MAG: oligosaccharide flippase family protein [Patescibacteria group bacterium]
MNKIKNNLPPAFRITQQSAVYIFWQILLRFAGYGKVIFFSRVLPQEILGAYFLFTSQFALLNSLSEFGFSNAGIKYISEGEDREKYFSCYLLFRILAGAAVVGLLLLFKDALTDFTNTGYFFWLLLLLGISSIQAPIVVGITGLDKLSVRSTCNALSSGITILIQILGVALGFGGTALAVGTCAGLGIGILLEVRYLSLGIQTPSLKHIKKIGKAAGWFFAASVMIALSSHIDALIIGHFLGYEDVSTYKVIFQLSTLSSIILAAFSFVLWPKINRWWKEDAIEPIQSSLSSAIGYSLALALPMVIGASLAGKEVLHFFYGTGYSYGHDSLVVLFAMQIFGIFYTLFTLFLQACNQLKGALIIHGVSGVINIVLSVTLVQNFGIMGPSLALLTSFCIGTILGFLFLAKRIKIIINTRPLRSSLIASLLMATLLFTGLKWGPTSSISLISNILFSGLIYIITFLFLEKKVIVTIRNLIQGST